MSFKTASELTKFSKLELAQLFSTVKFKFRKLGLEILLAPRSLDYARLLLCVARRYGNSPARNLFKRRIRAIFYEERLFDQDFDLVFVVKNKTGLKLDFQTLKFLTHDILQQANKLNK